MYLPWVEALMRRNYCTQLESESMWGKPRTWAWSDGHVAKNFSQLQSPESPFLACSKAFLPKLFFFSASPFLSQKPQAFPSFFPFLFVYLSLTLSFVLPHPKLSLFPFLSVFPAFLASGFLPATPSLNLSVVSPSHDNSLTLAATRFSMLSTLTLTAPFYPLFLALSCNPQQPTPFTSHPSI